MYQVFCLDDNLNYTLATSKLFWCYKDASEYASTVAPSRSPEVREEKTSPTETTWVYYYYNPFTNELVVVDRQLGFDLNCIEQQIGTSAIVGFAENFYEFERCSKSRLIPILQKDGIKISCPNKYWRERIKGWVNVVS